MSTGSEMLARAALCRIAEPGTVALARLVERLGAVETVERIRRGPSALPAGDADGVSLQLAEGLATRAAECEPEHDLRRLQRCGGRLVCPGDDDWPDRLDDLWHAGSCPPFALWLRGPGGLRELTARSVAVVGSRAATDYGTYVAAEMAAGLGTRGWSVVSGGAYGIDGAAHRGALAAGGPTVVVLACGVDIDYPRGHQSLFARIAAEHLLVSESPPGCAPHRGRFLVRNRLIAALTAGTVVVEAAPRSGALSTAGRAQALLRPVMAVPGPVTSTLSAGCHDWIRNRDVTLVCGSEQVIEQVAPMGEGLAPERVEPPRPRDELAAVERQVLDAVPVRQAVAAERIAVTAGHSVRATQAALRTLVRAGYVVRDHGGYRLARPGDDAPQQVLDLRL